MSLITITSGIGCEEMTIAQEVAHGLGVRLYDDQRLQKKAIEMGLSAEDLRGLNEKAPGLFNRLLRRKPKAYLNLLEAVVYEVARQGEGIVFGHGAQLLLQDFGCALHVRIYASEPSRIKNLIDRQGMSQEGAKKIIQKSDNERKGFLQFAFQMDWDDPSLYDLIINWDKLDVNSAATLIMDVAKSEAIKACSIAALESMERMSLLKKVHAAILKNSISPLEFQIEILENGVVQITGSLNPLESESNLLEVVKGVQGVKEVRSEIVVPRIPDIG